MYCPVCGAESTQGYNYCKRRRFLFRMSPRTRLATSIPRGFAIGPQATSSQSR
jgi:hypothetical protein